MRKIAICGQSKDVERLLLIECCMALGHVVKTKWKNRDIDGPSTRGCQQCNPSALQVGGVEIIIGRFRGW